MSARHEPTAVKKLENGDFAVQWKGSKKWCVIKQEDKIVFEYIVFWVLSK